MLRFSKLTAVVAVLVIGLAGSANAQTELISNGGFESGFDDWSTFGNAFVEGAAAPVFVPCEGNNLVSMFGNFSGGFDVTGIFQQFPASEGDVFQMDCATRHFSGDAVMGAGPGADNWVVMKLAFFDSIGEIGAAESIVMDGTFPTDTWIDNDPIQGVAPAGTTHVQALVLYLQPGNAGGACHVDKVSCIGFPVDHALSQDGGSGDLTISVYDGIPGAPYGIVYSSDPANGTMPGTGNFVGLHVPQESLTLQLLAAMNLTPYQGGFLDGAGSAQWVAPGAALMGLTGVQLWSIAGQYNLGTGLPEFSNIASVTLL